MRSGDSLGSSHSVPVGPGDQDRGARGPARGEGGGRGAGAWVDVDVVDAPWDPWEKDTSFSFSPR